jgi:hypothetical protein
MMMNTGNRNRVVLLGASGTRSVRSLRMHARDLSRFRRHERASFAHRLLNRIK